MTALFAFAPRLLVVPRIVGDPIADAAILVVAGGVACPLAIACLYGMVKLGGRDDA